MRIPNAWLHTCILSLASPALAQHCANFEPGSMSATAIQNEFQNGVLKLQLGPTDWATAYLVDSISGYALTAKHNVSGLTGAITANSPEDRSRKITLKVQKLSPNRDVALLKVVDVKSIANLRALDISFRIPNEDAELYSMGYPKYGDEQSDQLRFDRAATRAVSDAYIEVSHRVYGGNSGGPLLDSTGSVVGTCIERVGTGSGVARYVASGDIKDLLDEIPVSSRILALDRKLRRGEFSREELGPLLKKTSQTVTNLELYLWVKLIEHNRSQYAKLASYIPCPLVHALWHRKIDHDLAGLEVVSDPAVLGYLSLELGRKYAAKMLPLSAIESLRFAITNFQQSANIDGQALSLAATTRVLTRLGRYDDAANTLKGALALPRVAARVRTELLFELTLLEHERRNRVAALQALRELSKHLEETAPSDSKSKLRLDILSAAVHSEVSVIQPARRGPASEKYLAAERETVAGNTASALQLLSGDLSGSEKTDAQSFVETIHSEIIHHLKWSIFHEGCSIYPPRVSFEKKPPAPFRSCVLESQRHNRRASQLVASMDSSVLERLATEAAAIIPEEFGLKQHFKWVAIHEQRLETFVDLLTKQDYEGIRLVYSQEQSHNPNARNLLGAVPDLYIRRLIQEITAEVPVN